VARAALALREDVVFTQKLFGCFAEGFFCFDFSAAEFPAELQIPILGNLLGFREALFLCAGPAVLAGEIAGALPAAAVRAFVDVNLSTEDGVLFRHRGCPPNSFKKRKCERVDQKLLVAITLVFGVVLSSVGLSHCGRGSHSARRDRTCPPVLSSNSVCMKR